MSRLIIAIGLLAAAATAANYVTVDCGYVTSCEDCVQEDDVTSRNNYLERCTVEKKETTTADDKNGRSDETTTAAGEAEDTYYSQMLSCSNGKLVSTNYTDTECKKKDGASSSPKQCKEDPDKVKYVQLSGSKVKECGSSSECKGCTEYNVNEGKENECQVWTRTEEDKSTTTGGYKMSKKGGKHLLAVYSDEDCLPSSLMFQGLFDGTCQTLTKTTKYQCGSSIKDGQATDQDCGYVNNCGDCSTTVESGTVSINKCEMKKTEDGDESSTMGTCSGGTAYYSDLKCEVKKSTAVSEGCYLAIAKKYVKVSGNDFYYKCASKEDCTSAISKDSKTCTKYTGSDTKGKCTNEKKTDGSGSYFSYKLKLNGDKKHLTLYDAPNCDSKLLYQGELEEDKCVDVRQATKTTCGAAGAVALVAAAAAAAAALLL